MNKDKNFTGPPILSQISDVIPGSLTNKANRKYAPNRYYKKLQLGTHLVSLEYSNGHRALCEGLLSCEGKLSHLGFDKAPA